MAEIGRVLGGRYRLLELLGEGGMATIYRAHDSQLGRDVAVKLLRPEYGRDVSFVARFRQEAQAAASLTHPNIVGVFDYGTDEAGPFIVMELVDGEDLAEILRERGFLPAVAAARIAGQVAEALAAAHARGIIHRDIKTGNVLVRRDGRALVGDFGIARALSESELTLPGTTLGSVHYFSPEQARGEKVTAAADIYALGLVLFEMLTGRRPFEGDSAAAIAMARLTTDPPAPSALRADVPPALDAIVRKALAREPADRFASAAAFAEALRTFLGTRGAPVAAAAETASGAPPPFAPGAPTGAGESTVAAPPPYGGEEPPRRPVAAGRREPLPPEPEPSGSGAWAWAAALLGLLILVGAGALVVFALNSGPGPTATPGAKAKVPSLLGLSLEEAQKKGADAGFVVTIVGTEKSTAQPEGTVLRQDPAADAEVTRGSTVSVVIVSGKPLVTVPDLRGRPEQEAFRLILEAKLAIGERTEESDPVVPEGSVIDQSPRAGIQVPEQTSIDYVISTGPEPTPTPSPTPTPTPVPTPSPVVIPAFDGMSGFDYADLLTALGLDPTIQGKKNDPVVEVFPAPGAAVQPGSAVLVTTAAPTPAPPPTPTPTPTPTPVLIPTPTPTPAP